MDSSIEQLAQSLKAVIMYGDLDAPGHVAFPTCTDVAFVFVNCKLSANKQRTVILHELGHVAKQRDEIDLYNVAMSMKIKMEYGANRFMIKYLFNNYISVTGDEPSSVNYLDFMRQNDIPSRDENIVKDVIESY